MSISDEKNYVKMTETPVPKLVMRLAVPTTVSMLISSIYNTADTFFVSRISVSASGATGIVFALMALLQAFGFMFGHGAGSNISRLLGAKENEKATVFASTSFFLALVTGAVIGILGLIFIEPFMYLLGSTDTILNDAKTYGTFILIGAPALIASCVMNNILRYEGRAVYAMIGLMAGAFLNMALDPILIFGLKMDIAGAGLATAFSQYLSFFVLLRPFLKGQTSSKIRLRAFTKDISDIGNILITGTPNLLRQGLNSLSTSILNSLAAPYGDAAIAAFSIVSRCSNMIFAFAIGLAQGFQPVAAFNYGAKKYGRVRKAIIFTFAGAIGLVAVIGGVCALNAEKIISLFREEQLIVETGSGALRYMCLGMLLLPITAGGSMLFQSTGHKTRAIIIAMLQSGALYIPFMFILPRFFELKGLMLAQPAAYILSALIALPLVLVFLRELRLEEESLQK